MGGLSGFKYREIIKKLKKFGFIFLREAKGSYQIWYNPDKNLYTTIPKHQGDIPEGTLRAILKQTDIKPFDFINKK